MDAVIKDILGQPVNVGDKVVVNLVGYRDMVVAEVIKLTPKGIRVKLPKLDWRGKPEESQRGLGMFVKVPA